MPIDKWTAICLAGFLSSSTADWVTTRQSLSAGAVEANPIMRGVGLPAVKLGQDAALTAWTARVSKDHPRLVRIVLVAGTAFYTSLAVHNEHVYQQMRGR